MGENIWNYSFLCGVALADAAEVRRLGKFGRKSSDGHPPSKA